MRIVWLVFLLAFAIAPIARAQSFDQPWRFTSNPYSQTTNSCLLPQQSILFEDTGDYFFAPAAIYEVAVVQNFLHPIKLKPWWVEMYAENVDLSIWVCSGHHGNTVFDCEGLSDNGVNHWNYVEVPAQVGSYYVIVTQNTNNVPYPQCGTYFLDAHILN